MRVTSLFLLVLSVSPTEGFVAPKGAFSLSPVRTSVPSTFPSATALFAAENNNESENKFSISPPNVATATAAFWALTSTVVRADSPDWGIFEGRTGSLLHPIAMLCLLAFSISTALLGFDWRRQRTIGDEITNLKKSLPDLGGAKTVEEAIAAVKSAETVDQAAVNRLEQALPIEKQIDDLQAERKELSAKGPRDKHFSQGALLAFMGTSFALEGPLNTYARAGKLFPGPHLYAGAGLVFLWALAYSCVPAMQKGNDTARTIHIGANLVGIGMFIWQVTSGVPILLKVIENTQWP